MSSSASVRIVCRPDIAAGFAQAGLATTTADDGLAARALLRELARDPRVGLLLVDDRLHRALPADALKPLEHQARPLVVAFPGPRPDAAAGIDAEVIEILRRAIGYRVRLP